jgi:hypothetical protein
MSMPHLVHAFGRYGDYLNDAALGETTSKGDVQSEGAAGDVIDYFIGLRAHLHKTTLAKTSVNILHYTVQRFRLQPQKADLPPGAINVGDNLKNEVMF